VTPSATLRWFGITAFVLAVTGPATADEPEPISAQTTGNQQTLTFQGTANLTPRQMLDEAAAIITKMTGASGTVRRQLERARTSRDVVKTLCLNDKLSQIDVTTRSAQDRLAAIQSAVQAGELETAHHHFSILVAHSQHSQQVTSEANQCVGEEYAFVGATQTSVTIDIDMPGGEEAVTVNENGTIVVTVPLPAPGVSPTH
jgi:hypothetical protein